MYVLTIRALLLLSLDITHTHTYTLDSHSQFQNSLPYPDQVEESTSTFYRFRLKKSWHEEPSPLVTVGYILPSVIATMPWLPHFQLTHHDRTVTIPYAPGTDVESTAISHQLESARQNASFEILRRWRGELYQVRGIERDVRMARGGAALFGIHTVGVHLMAFCRTRMTGGEEEEEEMRLWIPTRAQTKLTYPGMLDNTVGGAITAGETQFECLLREAEQEASLPRELTTRLARPVGAISYFHVRDARAGGVGEVGLLQPATQYLFDIELGADDDVVPRARDGDGEVEAFCLWSVREVVGALREGRFKPNCAVAWIDFLIRHGFVDGGNEPDYLELVSRIHRRIHF